MKTSEKCLLATICLVLLAKSYAEYGWKPRVEYTFVLDGRSVAGFPSLGLQQHAGVHYRGSLRVQRDAAGVLYLKFQNMTYTKLHENLPQGWWSDTNSARENFRELPITSSTVAVKLGRHGVDTVTVKSDLSDWEINFIQGMVNQLQIDPKTFKSSNKNKKVQLNSSFKLMENSIFGRCEVLYEVTRVPRAVALAHPEWFPAIDKCGGMNFVEIFKTRNFTNCEYGAEFHFGLPSAANCHPGGNSCKDFLNRASVTRVTGCGNHNDFHILQSETNSRVIANLHLHKGTEASVSSYIAMNLKSMKPTTHRVSLPTDSVVLRDLKFKFTHLYELKDNCPMPDTKETNSTDYTEDVKRNKTTPINKHNGITEKTSTPETENPNVTDNVDSNLERNQWEVGLLGMQNPPHQPLTPYVMGLQAYEGSLPQIQRLRDIVTDAANDFQLSKSVSERMSLEKLLIAVRICRTMTMFQLKKAVGNVIFNSRNNNVLITESKLFRDVLVMCGTNPAFLILKSWIEQKDIKGEEASEVIAALPSHLQTPGPDVVRHFYDLVRSSAVREDQQLKITALLALSNLIRVACVESKARHSQYADEIFDATCEQQHASRYITWFISMLRSDTSLRRVYIAAIGNTGAAEALPHLRAIAEDQTFSSYLRATAVLAMKYHALNCPEATSKFLFSLYHDVGQPVPVRVAAVALLFYAKPQLVLLQRIAVLTWYDPSLAVAAFVRSSLASLSTVEDPEYSELSRFASIAVPLTRPVPTGIHKSHNLLWSRVSEDLQEVVLQQLSQETSLDATNVYYRYTQRLGGLSRVAFQGDMFVSNPDQFLTAIRQFLYPTSASTKARPAIMDLKRSTKWLREHLKISERKIPKFEGDLRIQFGKLTERIFPFDKELPVELLKAGEILIEQLKAGKDFLYQRVDQTTMRTAVPTELGFPVNFELAVPWAVRVMGNAKIDTANKIFETDLDMMYTSQLISEVSFFTAWDETVHMAASHGVSLIRLPPVKIKARLSTTNGMQLAFKKIHPDVGGLIFHQSSKPFTSQHGIFDMIPSTLKTTTSIIHAKRNPKEWSTVISDININYTTDSPLITPHSWLQNSINVHGFLMMWPSLDASSIDVKLEKLNSVSLEFGIGFQNMFTRGTKNEDSKYTECIPGEPDDTSLLNLPDLKSSKTQNITVRSTGKLPQVHFPTERSYWILDRLRDLGFHNVTTESTITTTEAENDVTSETEIQTPEVQTTEISSDTEQTTETTTQMPEPERTTIPNIMVKKNIDIDADIFNASLIDPFSVMVTVNRYKYVLDRILEGITSGKAYVLGLNITVDSASPKTYSTLWAYAAGRNGVEQRFGIFVRAEKHKIFFTSMLRSPVAPMLRLDNVIGTNISSTLNADFMWYEYENNTDRQLSLKTTMERTGMMQKYLSDLHLIEKCIEKREGPQTDISPDCMWAASEAMYMDKYTARIYYNKEIERYSVAAKEYFKYITYRLLPYVTDEKDDSRRQFAPSNSIIGILEIYPKMDTINARLRTRSTKTEFLNIPVSSMATKLLRFNPSISYTKRFKGSSYCGQGGNRYITFDGVAFDYNLTSCWHLLAKDCSGRSRIAILTRSTQNNEIELEVNLDNYKILNLRPDLNVSMNDEPMHLEINSVAEIADGEGTVLLQMEASEDPERIISVYMPAHGFHIIYTGTSTLIIVDRETRGRLCGICGDFDGDTVSEFRKPQGNQARNSQEYASSYALVDSECQKRQFRK